MSTIAVECGECGKTGEVPISYVGRNVKCPGCGAHLAIPGSLEKEDFLLVGEGEPAQNSEARKSDAGLQFYGGILIALGLCAFVYSSPLEKDVKRKEFDTRAFNFGNPIVTPDKRRPLIPLFRYGGIVFAISGLALFLNGIASQKPEQRVIPHASQRPSMTADLIRKVQQSHR